MTGKRIPMHHFELKYGFCNKSLHSANPPKSEDKYDEKVFNWSEGHLSEMACYKIHTLALLRQNKYLAPMLRLVVLGLGYLEICVSSTTQFSKK